MKKNVSGQKVGAQMITASDGSAFTGSVTVAVTGDAGTQATGSVGSGACTHEGNGYHTYAPAQAETNYDLIAFTFTGTGAIPATVQVYTNFPQTGDSYARLGAPAGASVSADVAAVKSETASILTDTAEIGAAGAGLTEAGGTGDHLTAIPWNASWDVEVQSECADALAAYDPPTNAEMEARTLPAASYFDPSADTVTNVTNVANASVSAMQATALNDFFTVDSGATYASDTVSGSVVSEIADNAGGSGLTAAAIADAVLDEALSGHTTAGTLGKAIADIETDVTAILDDTGTSGVVVASGSKSGYTISGTITTLDALDTAQDAQHSTTQSAIASLSIPTAAQNADAVLREALADHDSVSGSLAEGVSAILADTNELQTDDIPTTLATIASYIDTEVAAIKAVTDNLPDSGALTSIAQASALATVDTNVDTILARLQGIVLEAGTIGATGNDTTHVHIPTFTYGDDEINNYLLVIYDASEDEYHARYIEDWVNTSKLATVATLPFTPQASTDGYFLIPFRQDVTGGAGLDAAGVRAAVGLASANLDTQLGSIQTDATAILADTDELQTNQGDWATATGFSTHSAADVRIEMDSNSTQLAAIVADTNELQTDDTPTALASIASQITTVDGVADAIKAVTDNLPDSGALTSIAQASALATTDGKVDDILTDTGTTLPATLATTDGKIDDIKTKTDSLTFTQAGVVDANIQYVNDVEVTGDGEEGTEWGPA